HTHAGDVLYLSLEDKARRVRARAIRMTKKIGNAEAGRRLTIATDWPRQDQGGLAMIEHWYKTVNRPVLIIIDVWGMFKTPYRQRGSQCEQDSQRLGAVRLFVDNRGTSALSSCTAARGPPRMCSRRYQARWASPASPMASWCSIGCETTKRPASS